MGGRLEHEIRLLPQVLSCSFSKDDYVVVLVEPSADSHTIQRTVERILQNAGSEATVRVIGPAEPVQAAATRVVSPLVATATVATVAAIGVGALVGGLATAHHATEPARTPVRPAGASTLSTTDSLDVLRSIQVSAAAPVSAIQAPIEAPDRTLHALPLSRGTAVEAVSLTKAIPPMRPAASGRTTRSGTSTHHAAGREHAGRHRGKGPRSGSHSHSSNRDHRAKGMDRG